MKRILIIVFTLLFACVAHADVSKMPPGLFSATTVKDFGTIRGLGRSQISVRVVQSSLFNARLGKTTRGYHLKIAVNGTYDRGSVLFAPSDAETLLSHIFALAEFYKNNAGKQQVDDAFAMRDDDLLMFLAVNEGKLFLVTKILGSGSALFHGRQVIELRDKVQQAVNFLREVSSSLK